MSTEGAGNAAGAAPSPLTVGKHFVKQYYQVLQSNADQIFRFYQPTSFLSHAEGSNPTDPSGLENYDIAARWGIIGTESKGFAMEIGAIDAQTSIDNSILLVVTGSVSGSAKDERKTFIHTFFLTYIPNTKRFYVANDVLRFLEKTQSKEAGSVEEPETETQKEEAVVEETPVPTTVEEPTPVIPAVEETSPGGGVEETKEVEIEDEAPAEPVVEPTAAETPLVVESKEESPKAAAGGKDGVSGNKGKRGKGKVTQQQPKQQPASKPTPGSWASLVASSPAVASPPVPPSPAKPVTSEKPETTEKALAPVSAPAPKAKEAASKDSGKGGQRGVDRHKRDPDCTLVIKNLPDSAKDSDLMALFEGFAASTGGKILGTTVSVHRGLGFVDYDSVAPVLAAVAKHQEQPIELNGRVLDVDQKTAEQRTRRNTRGGGGTYRSGSPGNGGAYRGGSGGAGRSNQFRRGNNERGDRGGGGRGGGRASK